jgi:hypothetical protein
MQIIGCITQHAYGISHHGLNLLRWETSAQAVGLDMGAELITECRCSSYIHAQFSQWNLFSQLQPDTFTSSDMVT